MNRTLVVTRHPGAVAWLQEKGFGGEVITHLSPDQVVHLVAELKRRGARVFILVLPQVPPEKRGQELSSKEMDEFGARLLEVEELKLKEVV